MGKNRARKRRLLQKQQQQQQAQDQSKDLSTDIVNDNHTNTVVAENDDNQENVATTTTTTTHKSKGCTKALIKMKTRDISSLYAPMETYQCATGKRCVSCAYKCACFDVALDYEFTSQVPNVRPETCPRSTTTNTKHSDNHTMDNDPQQKYSSSAYQKGMNVLTVGDGDFSFSLAIARQILQPPPSQKTQNNHNDETEKEGGTVNNQQVYSDDPSDSSSSILIATSYEKEETLRDVYPNFDDTLNELKRLGAIVLFQVDATQLKKKDLGKHNRDIVFHRIVWNFPCSAIPNGQDGQNKEMDYNRTLIQKFIQQVVHEQLLHYNHQNNDNEQQYNGEIHMAHKTKPPYNQWQLEQLVVASSSCTNGDESISTTNHCLTYDGRIALDKCLYSPYTPRKALNKKSFPCHDACFYVFRIAHNHNRNNENSTTTKCNNSAVISTFPSTIRADNTLSVNRKIVMDEDDTNQKKKELILMTVENIKYIRDMHLNYAGEKILQKSYGLDKFYSKQRKKMRKT